MPVEVVTTAFISEAVKFVDNPGSLAILILTFMFFVNLRLCELIKKHDDLQTKFDNQFKFCLHYFRSNHGLVGLADEGDVTISKQN